MSEALTYQARVYGPPGTGKTYSACNWIAAQVQQGADPNGIAFVSFTRAACDEARRRIQAKLDLMDWELSYCKTIHALCRKSLNLEGGDWLLSGKALNEFASTYGYELQPPKASASEDMDEVVKSGGKDAALLAVWDFGRARLIFDAEAALKAFADYDPDAAGRVEQTRYLQFVEDYETHKGHAFKRDYTDLLRGVVEDGRPIGASVVCLDEAQDCSPLLWAAADVLFADSQARACMADDDQAIYSYQGADPDLFNQRPAEGTFQLKQSRRLPRRILEHAQSIIRGNRRRMDKEFLPVTPEIIAGRPDREPGPVTDAELYGEVHRVPDTDGLDLLNGESWFVLVRNWMFVPEITSLLEYQGVPYRIGGEAYYTPWDESKGPYKAARLIYTLSDPDGRVTLADLAPLLDKTRAATKETPGAWAYGRKTKINDLIEQSPSAKVGLLDLPQLGLTEWGFDKILSRDLELLAGGISQRDLDAYQASVRAGTWGQPAKVLVSTIHGVKGQEADNVAALLCCSAAPYRNLDRPDRREEEVRLAYVAVTRARKRFYGVDCELGQPYDEVFRLRRPALQGALL